MKTRGGKTGRGNQRHNDETVEPNVSESTLVDSTTGVEANIEEEAVNGNCDEYVVDSDDDSVEGDDCEVIVEDTSGYRETEPELAEETEAEENAEMIDVEVSENLEDHFGSPLRDDLDFL